MSDIIVENSAINKKGYPLLSRIKSPRDLKQLNESDLPTLCNEIRGYLIETLSENPGHFASSMGAVDIIVALHYVFDTPDDHIVFDVGHQAYAHKLITGRMEAFKTQRTRGGISGFPFPLESIYDTFVCGHAGNSISAALGMAIADKTTPGRENRKTIALIGDASISNGLSFEGLNNASQNPNNLLIILNDNDMSIDDNVGALHKYLTKITTSAGYNRIRFKLYNKLRKRGYISDKGKGFLLRFNNALKSLVARQQNIFEGLNIRYFGPFKGNDVIGIVKVLRDIKDMEGPRILHLHTTKGKGYDAAENNPAPWHAPGKFNPVTGSRHSEKISDNTPPLWQTVFGETLLELAKDDPAIVGITAAMPSGTSMNLLSQLPERMYDVGISEGHAVTFAGGLAASGKKPYVAIYSSFLQRAFDNIIHDVAIQGLPVTFCIDRAGVVGEDGVTHHGLFDMAYLRMIPGIAVSAPMDAETLRNLLYTSTEYNAPLAIRYPRGKCDTTDWKTPMKSVKIGKGRIVNKSENAKIAILSIGAIGQEVKKAITKLADDIAVDHYDMIWVKPLDEDLLREIVKKYDKIVTVEDGTLSGGFGSAIEEWMSTNGFNKGISRLGIPDKWIFQGTVNELHEECGIDAHSIERHIRNL